LNKFRGGRGRGSIFGILVVKRETFCRRRFFVRGKMRGVDEYPYNQPSKQPVKVRWPAGIIALVVVCGTLLALAVLVALILLGRIPLP
jgi:hypothetical protein